MKNCFKSRISENAGLSQRECEVVQLMSHGLTHKEAAKELYLSSYTVNDHVRNAIKKTGALNTANLIRISFERGILVPGEQTLII